MIVGSGGNDRLFGAEGDDVICGGPGDDKIYGNAGADVIKGQGFSDRLFPGRGQDQVMGGEGRDRVHIFTRKDVSIALESEDSPDVVREVEAASVTGVVPDLSIVLIGSSGRDMLSATAPGESHLRIRGGMGPDSLYPYTWSRRAKTESRQTTAQLSGGKGRDRLVTSCRLVTELKGGDGDDEVDGQGCVPGDVDYLPGPPTDTLIGGAGDDEITPNWKTVLVDGGAGRDHLNFGIIGRRVRLDLRAGTASVEFQDGAVRRFSVTAIENSTGLRGPDQLIGSDRANMLIGWDGNDVIEGLGGRDRLLGGAGHDALDGGRGRDRCSSGEKLTGCE